MRNPANNPLERLERLLDEIEELLAVFEWNAAGNDPLPRPPMIEYEREKIRRQLDYRRARKMRRDAQLTRARGGSKKSLRAQDALATKEILDVLHDKLQDEG